MESLLTRSLLNKHADLVLIIVTLPSLSLKNRFNQMRFASIANSPKTLKEKSLNCVYKEGICGAKTHVFFSIVIGPLGSALTDEATLCCNETVKRGTFN